MTIDWNAFTPWPSPIGGLLIGLAAALFALLDGRIAGISGIVGGLLRPAAGNISWRLAFLAGRVGAPLLWAAFAGPPDIAIVAAGLIVGVGTRYGSGCTSGHGLCGLSRRSPRPLAATVVFMAAGFATVFVVRHLING